MLIYLKIIEASVGQRWPCLIHPKWFCFCLSVCDASSDVCGSVPPPLSTSLTDPKEHRCCDSLALAPSQELPERGFRQQRTAVWGSNYGCFLSRFTPEAFSKTGCGHKAAEVLNQIFSLLLSTTTVTVLYTICKQKQ